MKQKAVMKLGNSVKKQVFKNILKFANFIRPHNTDHEKKIIIPLSALIKGI